MVFSNSIFRQSYAAFACCFLVLSTCVGIVSCDSDAAIVGSWTLERLSIGPELSEFPVAAKMNNRSIVLHIHEAESDLFRLQTKVVNRLSFSARITKLPSSLTFQAVQIRHGISTKLMGPADEVETEATFASGLSSADRWYVHDGRLLMTGPSMEVSFVRNAQSETSAHVAGRQLAANSDSSSVARAALTKLIVEYRALKITSRMEGAISLGAQKQLELLSARMNKLRQVIGRPRFEDVQPMPMPMPMPVPLV